MENDYTSILTKLNESDITVKLALCSVYGINSAKADKLCWELGINPCIKMRFVNDVTLSHLYDIICNYLDMVAARHHLSSKSSRSLQNMQRIQLLKETKNIKYFRLKNGLAVNGQRTHSNNKIAKLKLHFNE